LSQGMWQWYIHVRDAAVGPPGDAHAALR